MDPLPDLEVLVPSLSVLGLLGWLIVRLAIQNRQDRGDYRSARKDLHGRVAALQAELDRTRAAAQSELAAKNTELEEMRRRCWKAEDDAAKYRRQLSALRDGASG